MKNIASPVYQNFVISLIKFDIAKIKEPKAEKNFIILLHKLKEEKYIKENISININIKEKDKEKYHNQKLFEFALRYYFCVYLRIAKRYRDDKRDELFKQMILYYLLTDIRRAKYFLEEFSNNEVIDEYLIYCQNPESIKACLSLIIDSYKYVYSETLSNVNDSFAKDFLDTYIIYIDTHIRQVSMEAIRYLFLNLLEVGGNRFIKYLEKKSFDKWLKTFYGNEKKVYKNIINTDIYPILKSEHCILSVKNNNNKELLEKDSDMTEQQFLKNLNENITPNTNLIKRLMSMFDV
jgi:hypothetical protein